MASERGLKTYRRYFLDGEGRVRAAEWFEAGDDADALSASQAVCAEHPAIEVWERARRVGAVSREI